MALQVFLSALEWIALMVTVIAIGVIAAWLHDRGRRP